MFGYGGFASTLSPGYDGVLGRLRLARGGTYALTNIRGGCEYGPRWHTQTIREGRHKVAEDFAAIARDLINRGTTPAQLGATGGSNGGLLMGIMLTQYPELFGALVCSSPLLDMRAGILAEMGRIIEVVRTFIPSERWPKVQAALTGEAPVRQQQAQWRACES
jgi:prolyl oligopeptidase